MNIFVLTLHLTVFILFCVIDSSVVSWEDGGCCSSDYFIMIVWFGAANVIRVFCEIKMMWYRQVILFHEGQHHQLNGDVKLTEQMSKLHKFQIPGWGFTNVIEYNRKNMSGEISPWTPRAYSSLVIINFISVNLKCLHEHRVRTKEIPNECSQKMNKRRG